MQNLPGTVLPTEDITMGFDVIHPSIRATNGLTLAQVCTVTGLEQSTIQNWIKRGWVAHPENKRYGEYQLARIMIINMLRASMQLDNIAWLLRFVNGEADDRGDDIIPDSVLYTHLCVIVKQCEENDVFRAEAIQQVVEAALADYTEAYPGAKEKLTGALTVMALAFIASEIRKEAENLFGRLCG
ncbi:MAG: DUF1836 domain-containing protein [Clostridia bacterium]|nr:DUF1836 domain-containing protein [Clostridia bacterium]